MCVSLAVAGLAASAYSANQQAKAGAASAREAQIQGHAQQYEGFYEQEMRKIDAKNVEKDMRNDLDNLMAQRSAIRGAIAARQGASGFMSGDGSNQAQQDLVDQGVHADALAIAFTGTNKSSSIRNSGAQAAERGSQSLLASNRSAANIVSAANAQATGTLIGGAVKYGGRIYGGLQ